MTRDQLNKMTLQQLREEYKQVRKLDLLYSNRTNREFDWEVFRLMESKKMISYSVNYVLAAQEILTETLFAEEERLSQEEYQGDFESPQEP